MRLPMRRPMNCMGEFHVLTDQNGVSSWRQLDMSRKREFQYPPFQKPRADVRAVEASGSTDVPFAICPGPRIDR